jgi:transglutaminase-like putative cysteine protease
MLIKYGCELAVVVNEPTPAQCLMDIHSERQTDIVEEIALTASSAAPISEERDGFGNRLRRLILPAGETVLRLSGIIADSGIPEVREGNAPILPVPKLPADVLGYLNGSRYCETDKLGEMAWRTFGHLPRYGTLVQTICDFTNQRLAFDYQQARSTRTAVEAYEERVGVCRDFAHLAIALCRCLNIPARYVNGYLGDIGVPFNPAPMDFNAWFEVYLGGAWHTWDARHNQPRIGRIPVARGRDACDVPMLHTFGPHQLKAFAVTTEEVGEAESVAAKVRRACSEGKG